MKTRKGFVSNSSSSSFIITNKTDKDLTLTEFVKEFGKHLVETFNRSYDYKHTYKEVLLNAKKRDKEGYTYHEEPNWESKVRKAYFLVGENIVSFGDDDGDTLGAVFDYMLRDEYVDSDRFSVRFHEHQR